MKLKGVLLLMGAALIAIVARHSFSAAVAAQMAPAADAATAQMILQASIQIALYEIDEKQGIEVGGRGLGTLVHHNGETLIVTHDHWTHLSGNLRQAEFRNARGDLLLTVTGSRLLSLIRYRDGGTLIMTAPAGLSGLTPVAVKEGTAAGGNLVWVTRRDRAEGGKRVEVVAAVVETVTGDIAPPRVKLRGADGAVVIPGDSGGGIWSNGQLLGNLWSGGVEIRRSWVDKLRGSSRQTETSLIYAALLPAGEIMAMDSSAPGSQSLATAARAHHLPER